MGRVPAPAALPAFPVPATDLDPPPHPLPFRQCPPVGRIRIRPRRVSGKRKMFELRQGSGATSTTAPRFRPEYGGGCAALFCFSDQYAPFIFEEIKQYVGFHEDAVQTLPTRAARPGPLYRYWKPHQQDPDPALPADCATFLTQMTGSTPEPIVLLSVNYPEPTPEHGP